VDFAVRIIASLQSGEKTVLEIERGNAFGGVVVRKVLKNGIDAHYLEKVRSNGLIRYRITELGRAYVAHHLGD